LLKHNASVEVRLFVDRLEVWNPGRLPDTLTLDSLRVDHPSVPYNPLIAESLYLTRYIEKVGSGTQTMINLCRDAGTAGAVPLETEGAAYESSVRPSDQDHGLPQKYGPWVLSLAHLQAIAKKMDSLSTTGLLLACGPGKGYDRLV
jgi:hypothetical protein